jgi:hypothetical protein
MNIATIKLVTGLVASFGVGTVINNVAKATVPPMSGTITRVATVVGAITLGGMVHKPVMKYAGEFVDDINDMIHGDPNKVRVWPS